MHQYGKTGDDGGNGEDDFSNRATATRSAPAMGMASKVHGGMMARPPFPKRFSQQALWQL